MRALCGCGINNDLGDSSKELDKEPKESRSWYQILSVMLVSFSCISCGCFLGFTSSAVPSMKLDMHTFPTLESLHISLIGGLGPLGALVGAALITPFSLKYLGTRRTIGFLGLPPNFLSWVIIGFLNQKIEYILIGRFIGGIGVGATISSAPLYVMEVSSVERRGRLGIMPQLLMLVGILLSYVGGTFFDWKNLARAIIVLPTTGALLLLVAPDAPKWIFRNGNPKEALNVLTRLHGNKLAELFLTTFEDEVNLQRSVGKMGLLSAFSLPENRKPIFLGLLVIALQQLSGINGVTFFALSIFEGNPISQDDSLIQIENSTSFPENFVALQESNLSSSLVSIAESSGNSGHLPSIFLALSQVAASFLSSMLIEHFGRRPLLQLSSLIVSLSTLMLGIYFYLRAVPQTDVYLANNVQWLPLILLVVFCVGFSIGLGPITWILIAELLPDSLRQTVNPLMIAFYWLSAFMVTSSFPWLKESVNLYGIFWIYSSVALLGCVSLHVFLPETKGKSVTEIASYFLPKVKDDSNKLKEHHHGHPDQV